MDYFPEVASDEGLALRRALAAGLGRIPTFEEWWAVACRLSDIRWELIFFEDALHGTASLRLVRGHAKTGAVAGRGVRPHPAGAFMCALPEGDYELWFGG